MFGKPEACGQIVLPDRSLLIGQKLLENAKNWKIQMRHFECFSNIVHCVFLCQDRVLGLMMFVAKIYIDGENEIQ